MLWKYLLLLVLSVKLASSARLELSNDDVVIEAIRENRNLIILFGELGVLKGSRKTKINYLTFSEEGLR